MEVELTSFESVSGEGGGGVVGTTSSSGWVDDDISKLKGLYDLVIKIEVIMWLHLIRIKFADIQFKFHDSPYSPAIPSHPHPDTDSVFITFLYFATSTNHINYIRGWVLGGKSVLSLKGNE